MNNTPRDYSFISREFPDRRNISIYYISDLHTGAKNCYQEQFEKFIDFLHTLRHLFFVEVYVEYPEYKILEEFSQTDMEQRYWSLSFAKEKAKLTRGIWKYLYYLPIPRLWAKKYRNEWEAKAILDNKKIFMTDFI